MKPCEVWTHSPSQIAWHVGPRCVPDSWVHNGEPTHCRPLVVIDPESAEDVARLEEIFAVHCGWSRHLAGDRRDHLAAALREFAAPTPPRPDEPQGLGAVVEDAAGGWWVRTHMPLDAHWRSADFQGNYRPWGALDAVRVLSEGVTR